MTTIHLSKHVERIEFASTIIDIEVEKKQSEETQTAKLLLSLDFECPTSTKYTCLEKLPSITKNTLAYAFIGKDKGDPSIQGRG